MHREVQCRNAEVLAGGVTRPQQVVMTNSRCPDIPEPIQQPRANFLRLLWVTVCAEVPAEIRCHVRQLQIKPKQARAASCAGIVKTA